MQYVLNIQYLYMQKCFNEHKPSVVLQQCFLGLCIKIYLFGIIYKK